MSEKLIFIPYNVPSLKNSKVKTSRGIFASKTVAKYIRNLGIRSYSPSKKVVVGYVNKPNIFKEIVNDKLKKQIEKKEYPIILGLHFVRDSKRDFDFNNVSQIIQDLLVAHDIIEDDCMRVMISIPFKIKGSYYTLDKENPGVYLKIM